MEIKEKIKTLMNEELSREKIAEVLVEYRCMAEEFKESFPTFCGEDADCYDCWKQRIDKFIDESEDLD
ncbi:MAG: hypothetical protein ACRDA5_02315 [Clostridium sp.]